MVWLTTNLEATPGSVFAGSGDADQDESWTLVLNRANRMRMALHGDLFGNDSVLLPIAIAADMSAELAFRLGQLDDLQDEPIALKVIYTVTVLTYLRDQAIARHNDAGALEAVLEKGRGSRTWGWFATVEDARAALAQ
jgi:hypothetical protein